MLRLTQIGEGLGTQQLAPDRAAEEIRTSAMARECAEQCSQGTCKGATGAVERGEAIGGEWRLAAPLSRSIDLAFSDLSSGPVVSRLTDRPWWAPR